MIRFLRTLTPRGIAALATLVIIIIIGAGLLLHVWQSGATAKAEAKLATNQTGAAIASGVDAVEAVGRSQAAEVRINVITRENDRAIRQAPGADAPVDPAADAAGRASLCRRAAYRGHPECLQQPAAE